MARTTHLNIMELFAELKKSTDEQTAMTISSAFEKLINDQEERVVGTKNTLLQEIDARDFATKKDLKELEFATKKDLKELEIATKKEIKELELTTQGNIKELELVIQRDIKSLELKIKELDGTTTKGIKELELTTQGNIKELELKIKELELSLTDKFNNAINIAKWQVIGSVALMIFLALIVHHFGF